MVSGTASYQSDRNSAANEAIIFDGSTVRVQFPIPIAANGQDFTLALWLAPEILDGDGSRSLRRGIVGRSDWRFPSLSHTNNADYPAALAYKYVDSDGTVVNGPIKDWSGDNFEWFAPDTYAGHLAAHLQVGPVCVFS